jgi:competence protein ComEC
MVIRIAYGHTSALLEGDAEKRTERAIAAEVGPVNLLKVGHHGSNTSSIRELLDKIQPQFAVISVGRFNRYGHPAPQVLTRISQEGACLFRTDVNGAVSFYLDGTRLTEVHWGRERVTMDFLPRWIPRQEAGHCAALQ